MYSHEKDGYYEQEYYPTDKKEGHCKDCHKDKGKKKGTCVEEILEAILKAQRKAEKENDGKCSSCEESYEEMLEEPVKKFKKNTIPFILYCGCEPFKAEGVMACPVGIKDKKLVCVKSFIFKIRDLKGDCAVLELLTFKPSKGRCDKAHEPCDQINHQHVNDLMKTGICINIDLSCFCGISTLPAVRL